MPQKDAPGDVRAQIVPSGSGFTITPHDTNDLAFVTRGIYVGVTGNLNVLMRDGTTVDFTAIAAGVIHPIAAKRVMATGTTATGLRGLI